MVSPSKAIPTVPSNTRPKPASSAPTALPSRSRTGPTRLQRARAGDHSDHPDSSHLRGTELQRERGRQPHGDRQRAARRSAGRRPKRNRAIRCWPLSERQRAWRHHRCRWQWRRRLSLYPAHGFFGTTPSPTPSRTAPIALSARGERGIEVNGLVPTAVAQTYQATEDKVLTIPDDSGALYGAMAGMPAMR